MINNNLKRNWNISNIPVSLFHWIKQLSDNNNFFVFLIIKWIITCINDIYRMYTYIKSE